LSSTLIGRLIVFIRVLDSDEHVILHGTGIPIDWSIFGVAGPKGYLGDSANATSLTDLFRPGAIPPLLRNAAHGRRLHPGGEWSQPRERWLTGRHPGSATRSVMAPRTSRPWSGKGPSRRREALPGLESKILALILAKSENHAIKWRSPDKSVRREARDQLPARRWEIGVETGGISLFESGRNPLKSPDSEK
jgi:hypothetical protein